ncbi:MAG: hypothetical protein P8170_13975 [Gemmatimonadota bacterium]
METVERSGFDWLEVAISTMTVEVVAFVVLQLKEWVDAGRFDTPGTMVDALLVAGGMLILYVIQQLWKRTPWS